MERYKIIKPVGDGTFGTVYKAINRATGEVCAIKKMKKTFGSWEECLNLREIKSLSKFSNSFIVKLKEVFRVNNELHMVFEYMDENLYELIKDRASGLPECQIKSIISQVLQGLVYMHKHGFFHRDLKPENLMVSGSTCKITDFGLAREIRTKPPFTDYVSTRWYRAPEILLRSTNYNSPVDLFALGCIMAELYNIHPLAPGANETDQILRLCSILGPPKASTWPEGLKLAAAIGFKFPSCSAAGLAATVPQASPEALELMTALLMWDPAKRPTAAESLKFAFFEGNYEGKMQDVSAKNSSKWSHGSSRITGNSSKGKWSFRAANSSSKDLALPMVMVKDKEKGLEKEKEIEVKPNAVKRKVESRENEPRLPAIFKKMPSRKVSRERMALGKGEMQSPRYLQQKFLTNQISPRNVIKLPPISAFSASGNVMGKGK